VHVIHYIQKYGVQRKEDSEIGGKYPCYVAFCGVMWNLGSLLTFGPVLRIRQILHTNAMDVFMFVNLGSCKLRDVLAYACITSAEYKEKRITCPETQSQSTCQSTKTVILSLIATIYSLVGMSELIPIIVGSLSLYRTS
jgi:hypothetical protein